jgi:hypothetical protein
MRENAVIPSASLLAVPRREANGLNSRHLDVWMGVQSGQREVVGAGVHVVQQQAHAHAAVGRAHQFARQHPAGQVVVPDVVLHVEAALGVARRQPPQRERLDAIGDQPEPGLARMLLQSRKKRAIQRGVVRHRQGMLRRQLAAWWQARAARCGQQRQHGGQQQQVQATRSRHGCHGLASRGEPG